MATSRKDINNDRHPRRIIHYLSPLNAPRELVWHVWTDPDQLSRWFGPRGLSAPRSSIEMDVRPGGAWRITMVNDADGIEYPQVFTFREVIEPERLVFTATNADGIHEPSALITLTLTATEAGTELTFRVEGLPAGSATAGLEEGWSSSFDCLAELVEAKQP